jgi:hypothetical protein
MNRLTALGRTIDLAYPSNRVALGLLLLGFAGLGLLGGSWLGAVAGGLWVFATWALGRELDPDRPRTANLSGAAVLLGLALARPEPFFLLHGMAVTGGTMLAARLLGRTTGRSTTGLDGVTLALMTPVLGWLTSRGLWPLGLAAGLALYLDALHDRKPARGWLWGGLALLGGVVLAFLGRGYVPALPGWLFWVSLVALVLGGLELLRPYTPQSAADDATPLLAARLSAARRVVALAALLLSLTLGPSAGLSLGLVGTVRWFARPRAGR